MDHDFWLEVHGETSILVKSPRKTRRQKSPMYIFLQTTPKTPGQIFFDSSRCELQECPSVPIRTVRVKYYNKFRY